MNFLLKDINYSVQSKKKKKLFLSFQSHAWNMIRNFFSCYAFVFRFLSLSHSLTRTHTHSHTLLHTLRHTRTAAWLANFRNEEKTRNVIPRKVMHQKIRLLMFLVSLKHWVWSELATYRTHVCANPHTPTLSLSNKHTHTSTTRDQLFSNEKMKPF